MSRDGHESLNKRPVLAKRKDAPATVWLSPAGDSGSQVNALFGFYSFIAQVYSRQSESAATAAMYPGRGEKSL